MGADDDDFVQKESTDEADEHESEQLNRQVTEGVSATAVHTMTLTFSGIGFILGAAALGGLIIGTLCVFEVINQVMGGLGAMDVGGEVSIMEQMKDQLKTCIRTSAMSPIGLLSIGFGGLIGALPGYKAAKAIANGKLLRSLL